jgi:Zn-dependent protease with chaperone function
LNTCGRFRRLRPGRWDKESFPTAAKEPRRVYDTTEHIQIWLLIAFLLQIASSAALDSTQLRSRIYHLTGRKPGLLSSGSGRTFRSTFWPIWGVWIVNSFIRDFSRRPATPVQHHWLLWQKIAVAALYAALLLFMTVDFRSEMRFRALGTFRLSRGKLFQAVAKLSKKSSFFGLQDAPLFVIPDVEFATVASRASRGVVLPLGLLDQLSREEIKALAARQLCVQSRKFYFPANWILLCCNVIIAAFMAVVALRPDFGTPVICGLCVALMAVELFAIDRFSSRMLFEADLRAIRLCDNAETFFSALGGFSRLTGAPLNEQDLRKLGKTVSISRQRIYELLATDDAKPEDRFPTAGSYMDTGL